MSRIIFSIVVIGALCIAQPQYKKAHRAALRKVVDGQAGAVVTQMRARMAVDPSDPEDWFLLAIALVKRGDLDEAVAAVARAEALGLPAGRLAAASVDWLEPIAGREPLSKLRARMKHSALMGPMVGHVGPDEAHIWVRTLTEVEVSVEGVGSGIKKRTSSTDDYTAVLRITGLEPEKAYSGHLRIDGQRDPNASFSFKTAPLPESSAPFTLAFGGGAGFTPHYEHMWKTIERADPDFMLLLGDNVYIDQPKHPDVQRFCYHRRQGSRPYQRLLQRTPTWSIWDDHDFGTNDCHGGPDIDSRPWKRAVWNVYRANWANPAYGLGGDDIGCWYRFTWGAVEFFMLDGRTWRTNPKKPGGSMLGPVQKKWLKDAVKQSKATFKVLCSPVPWAKGTKPGSKDTWDGFPEERREILDFLAVHDIEGVVLMSADRHRSDAWMVERKGAYDLFELNSSRLTNVHKHRAMKRALFSYNRTPSFGLVHFEPGGDDPRLTYEVVTIDGLRVHRLEIPLSKLR